MVNYIWAFLIIVGTVGGIATGRADAVSQAALDGAKDAALLCVSLIGAYILWLGVLNVAKEAGLVDAIARRMRGVIRSTSRMPSRVWAWRRLMPEAW